MMVSTGKYKKAHRKLLSLPEEIRKDRLFQIMDLQIAANLDENTFIAVYHNYIDQFPEQNGVVMSFAVEAFHPIAFWLLSFGEQIVVRVPIELKKMMKEEVRKLAGIYLS